MSSLSSLLVLALACPSGSTQLSDRYLADPYAFKHQGYYYVFGTVEDGQQPCFFRTRTFAPSDLEWYDLDFDLGGLRDQVRGIWGFTPFQHADGSYHGYGTIHFGWFRTVVAHFVPQPGEEWTPEKPIARWRFDRILVGDRANEEYAYESKVYADEDGTLYLIYSAGHPEEKVGVDIHIKARRLLDPATPDPNHTARPILSPSGLRSEDRNPGAVQIVEGANIVRRDGVYLLFYSVGDYMLGNYKVGLAWSDSLIPPPGETYRKTRRPDPENLWGNPEPADEVRYVLQTEHSGWPNYVGDCLEGPGLANLIRLDGGDMLVFHAHPRPGAEGPDPARHPWVMPVSLTVTSSGAPRVQLAPVSRP